MAASGHHVLRRDRQCHRNDLHRHCQQHHRTTTTLARASDPTFLGSSWMMLGGDNDCGVREDDDDEAALLLIMSIVMFTLMTKLSKSNKYVAVAWGTSKISFLKGLNIRVPKSGYPPSLKHEP